MSSQLIGALCWSDAGVSGFAWGPSSLRRKTNVRHNRVCSPQVTENDALTIEGVVDGGDARRTQQREGQLRRCRTAAWVGPRSRPGAKSRCSQTIPEPKAAAEALGKKREEKSEGRREDEKHRRRMELTSGAVVGADSNADLEDTKGNGERGEKLQGAREGREKKVSARESAGRRAHTPSHSGSLATEAGTRSGPRSQKVHPLWWGRPAPGPTTR